MDISTFAADHGIRNKDIVNTVREQHSKYDAPLHSKVLRPDLYGIRLVESAEQLVEDTFVKTPCTPHRADKRRRPCRLQCRVSNKRKTELQQAFRADGYKTIDDGLRSLINAYLGGELE